jgi:hypothetical protein
MLFSPYTTIASNIADPGVNILKIYNKELYYYYGMAHLPGEDGIINLENVSFIFNKFTQNDITDNRIHTLCRNTPKVDMNAVDIMSQEEIEAEGQREIIDAFNETILLNGDLYNINILKNNGETLKRFIEKVLDDTTYIIGLQLPTGVGKSTFAQLIMFIIYYIIGKSGNCVITQPAKPNVSGIAGFILMHLLAVINNGLNENDTTGFEKTRQYTSQLIDVIKFAYRFVITYRLRIKGAFNKHMLLYYENLESPSNLCLLQTFAKLLFKSFQYRYAQMKTHETEIKTRSDLDKLLSNPTIKIEDKIEYINTYNIIYNTEYLKMLICTDGWYVRATNDGSYENFPIYLAVDEMQKRNSWQKMLMLQVDLALHEKKLKTKVIKLSANPLDPADTVIIKPLDNAVQQREHQYYLHFYGSTKSNGIDSAQLEEFNEIVEKNASDSLPYYHELNHDKHPTLTEFDLDMRLDNRYMQDTKLENILVQITNNDVFKDSSCDIVIFVAMIYQARVIDKKIEKFRSKNPELYKDYEVVKYYSALTEKEHIETLKKINHSDPTDDKKYIIIATDILQTGVTLPRLRIIIDLGIRMNPLWHPEIVCSHALKIPINADEAIQRYGRVGRTSEGHIYTTYTEAEYAKYIVYNSAEGNKNKYMDVNETEDILLYYMTHYTHQEAQTRIDSTLDANQLRTIFNKFRICNFFDKDWKYFINKNNYDDFAVYSNIRKMMQLAPLTLIAYETYKLPIRDIEDKKFKTTVYAFLYYFNKELSGSAKVLPSSWYNQLVPKNMIVPPEIKKHRNDLLSLFAIFINKDTDLTDLKDNIDEFVSNFDPNFNIDVSTIDDQLMDDFDSFNERFKEILKVALKYTTAIHVRDEVYYIPTHRRSAVLSYGGADVGFIYKQFSDIYYEYDNELPKKLGFIYHTFAPIAFGGLGTVVNLPSISLFVEL